MPEDDARILTQDPAIASFFEEAMRTCPRAEMLANWINNEVLRLTKGCPVGELRFGPAALAELVQLIDQQKISGKTAKEVFAMMAQDGRSPAEIVRSHDLEQINDKALLEPLVDEVIRMNGDAVANYKSGNERLFGFFVGLVMKKTHSRANADVVNQLLQQKLKS